MILRQLLVLRNQIEERLLAHQLISIELNSSCDNPLVDVGNGERTLIIADINRAAYMAELSYIASPMSSHVLRTGCRDA